MLQARRIEAAEAARLLKVSRGTVFNWYGRQRPPPNEGAQERLREFFGVEADYLFTGEPSQILGSSVQEIAAHEYVAVGEAAATLVRDIEAHVAAQLAAARSNVVLLGWLLEQMRRHAVVRAAISAPLAPDLSLDPAHNPVLARLQAAARADREAERRPRGGSATG